MKKRMIGGFVALAGVICVAVTTDLPWAVLGFLKQEHLHQGRPTSYWRGALADDDPPRHEATRKQLQTGGGSAVAVLGELLTGTRKGDWNDADVRSQAAEILGKIGPEATPAVRDLIGALD